MSKIAYDLEMEFATC